MFTARALREARGPFLVLGLLTVAAALCAWWAALIPLLLMGLTLAFFRDPARRVPEDPLAIVSPADGRVVGITRTREEVFLQSDCTMIAIFLSILDVHVQRSPIRGEVKLVRLGPGGHRDARHALAGTLNQHRLTALEAEDGQRLVLRQIAGRIARRIVGWAEAGARLEKGQRLGMIRFGSRVELYLPGDPEVLVRPGQHVKGGETILARR